MPSGTASRLLGILLVAALSGPLLPLAASTEAPAPAAISPRERAAILDKIAELFRDLYPDPGLTEQMISHLRHEEERRAYDGLATMKELTSRLTADMRTISHDRHITIWPYEPIPEDLLAENRLGSPDENYGFETIQRLPGNIGYLKLTSFSNPRTAGPTAVAAMSFLAHTDALILDLRFNGGGDEAMALFLSSFLFPRSTHLLDVQIPSEDRRQQTWTLEYVPGPRLIDQPVYVLVNRMSYSSSEELAFGLQQTGRALVVGEQTRGGAHAVRYMSFPEIGVNIRVPYTTSVKRHTNISYLQGIVPDIPASSDDAFALANVHAISILLEQETDAEKRYVLEWTRAGYQAELRPVILDQASLDTYAGRYGDTAVYSGGGHLFLRRKGHRSKELMPLGNDDFRFVDPDEAHYRVRFNRDDAGRIVELLWHDSDGDSYPPERRSE